MESDRINLRRISPTRYVADTMGGYVSIDKYRDGWVATFVSTARTYDGTAPQEYPRRGWDSGVPQRTHEMALTALFPWLE